jgi:hypothetical protein
MLLSSNESCSKEAVNFASDWRHSVSSVVCSRISSGQSTPWGYRLHVAIISIPEWVTISPIVCFAFVSKRTSRLMPQARWMDAWNAYRPYVLINANAPSESSFRRYHLFANIEVLVDVSTLI